MAFSFLVFILALLSLYILSIEANKLNQYNPGPPLIIHKTDCNVFVSSSVAIGRNDNSGLTYLDPVSTLQQSATISCTNFSSSNTVVICLIANSTFNSGRLVINDNVTLTQCSNHSLTFSSIYEDYIISSFNYQFP